MKNEGTKLKSALTGAAAHDSRRLEEIFESVRAEPKKMTQLVRAFCESYMVDQKQRPLKLRPLQENIIAKALCYSEEDSDKHVKLAILAPRGSGKSFALSVAVVIYMFFKRFRDLIFILAPSEDQAALIFNYVYRHFADNTFLDSLVANYRFHNKPSITMKGGTVLRRAPLAPSNQGQAIRGQHPTFLVIDESPLIDDKLFVDNVEPCIVANRAPFINLGTPKSKDNHMWRYLYDDAYAESFERLHYTWKDAIVQGRAYEPAYTEEDMLTKMMEWGEDSIYWKTEYECEFVESVSNVFNPEKLKACMEEYDLYTRDRALESREELYNINVGVDIGKSVNSTAITVWRTEKHDGGNIARLIYIEEISPKTGGHDIPYQRERIIDVAKSFNADRLIVDATGIGGAIEQDLRMACIPDSIHFIGFVFTGGPKGTKTQVYRDYVSYIQKGQVKVPDFKKLPENESKLVRKWLREHTDLEYVMDIANKTEKISAPDTKHDDYCDSSVMGIHAALSMLPAEGSFASVSVENKRSYKNSTLGKASGNMGVFTSKTRNKPFSKRSIRWL